MDLCIDTNTTEDYANDSLWRTIDFHRSGVKWSESAGRIANNTIDGQGLYHQVLPLEDGFYCEDILVMWWRGERTSNRQSCFDWMTDAAFQHLLFISNTMTPTWDRVATKRQKRA
jgi:hypothetical protein